MNDYRKGWAKRAFKKMDKTGDGKIELEDLKGTYNAHFHPDVKSGKRTEDDVLLEFLETFETHHNILMGKACDHSVTEEEFEEYYNNISMSIDNDEYFALMMRNAWKLDEADRVYEKGWKGEESKMTPQKTSPGKWGKTNLSSPDNTLNFGAKLYNKLSVEKAKGIEQACEFFRKKLASRGARGIIGIARQFRVRYC